MECTFMTKLELHKNAINILAPYVKLKNTSTSNIPVGGCCLGTIAIKKAEKIEHRFRKLQLHVLYKTQTI